MNPGFTGYGGSGSSLQEPPHKINFGWVSEAWTLFSAKAGVWIGASALLLLPIGLGYVLFLVAVFSIIGVNGSSSHPSMMATVLLSILGILSLLLMGGGGYFLSCGLHGMATKQIRGEQIEFADVFRGRAFFWRALGLSLLLGIGVYIGTLFLVVPGLILAGLTLPALSLVTDGERVIPAIQRSIDAMKGDLLNSVLLVLLLQVILSAGSLVLGVGIFVAMPIYWLVSALAYRDMVGMPGVPRGGWKTVPSLSTAWTQHEPQGVWPPPPSVNPSPMNIQPGDNK